MNTLSTFPVRYRACLNSERDTFFPGQAVKRQINAVGAQKNSSLFQILRSIQFSYLSG